MLTTYHYPVPLSRNLGTLTSWNPLRPSGPVTGLLYLLRLLSSIRKQKATSIVHRHNHHHHHHHHVPPHVACRALGLVTFFGPVKSLAVF